MKFVEEFEARLRGETKGHAKPPHLVYCSKINSAC